MRWGLCTTVLWECHVGRILRPWRKVGEALSQPTLVGPSHFHKPTGVARRIDKIFTRIPMWALRKINWHSALDSDPFLLHHAKISDHSPIGACAQPIKPKQRANKSISNKISKSPRFVELIDILCD